MNLAQYYKSMPLACEGIFEKAKCGSLGVIFSKIYRKPMFHFGKPCNCEKKPCKWYRFID